MTSSRPYLIRAIYQWIVDNNSTPHVLVDTSEPDVVVPVEYIENNKIILNLGPSAVQNLSLGNDLVEFNARFAGQSMLVSVPVSSVLAIYAKENGQGMVFSDNPSDTTPDTDKKEKPARPSLKIVK